MISNYSKYDWLNYHFKKNPEKIFICTNTIKYSFAQVREIVDSIKVNLSSINLLNKNIGVIATPTQDYFFTLLALWELDANPVLIPSGYKETEINEIINYAKSSLLLTFHNSLQAIPNSVYPFEVISTNKHIDSVTENNYALMILSSGTTSIPKIVCHSFDSLFNSYLISDSFIKHEHNDKWILSLSPSHIGGFSIFLRALIAGCQLIIPNSLKINDIFESIKIHKPNLISFTPSSLDYIAEYPDLFSSFKFIFIGGAATNNKNLLKLIKLNLPLVKVYGSSETAAMITAVNLLEHKDKIESSGKPLKNVKISISDKEEILVESPSLFVNYFNNNETNLLKNYQSKDVGYIDNEGFLYVTDRKDDIIISGGMKINPYEVRNAFINIEEIKDAFVFSVPDTKWGEKVCAALITKQIINIDQLKAQLKNIIADYKIPKEIIIIDSFPLNQNGKIDKKTLVNILISKT